MSAAGDSAAGPRAELRVVGTTVAAEIESLFDRLAAGLGRRAPHVLQVGSRTLVAERNVRNWRSLVMRRFEKARFVGIDLEAGPNVDHVLDICASTATVQAALGADPFDLVLCCHVLEHTLDPGKAARTLHRLARPGGLLFVSAAWSQAFHATPDDLWRFSLRGLVRLLPETEVVSAFYSGGDVGLDVAYRVMRGDRPDLDPRAGAVEQGLFQLVLDHEDNRAVLARQATERLPVSRTYLPTLFVNLVGQKPA